MAQPLSSFDFNVNLNLNASALVDVIKNGFSILQSFAKELHHMSQEMDDLKNQIAMNSSTVDSALALIAGIADRITQAGVDPAALASLTQELKSEDDALAAAVAANVVPTPTPTP
jgi:hypothetical protein